MKLLSEFPSASMSMAASQSLRAELEKTFAAKRITHVIETGTYLGLGSTTFVSQSFDNGIPDKFVTIEANWVSWRHALRNLAKFPFVLPIWGRTVSVGKALGFIETDDVLKNHMDYPDLFIDDINDPVKFYRTEIFGGLGGKSRNPKYLLRFMFDRLFFFKGDNLLEKYLCEFRNENPLVILDSAGGIGFLEFSILRQIMDSHSYLLLLDDINHIKHFRSYQCIENDERFRMLAKDELGGWIFAEYEPDKNSNVGDNNAFI